MKDSDLWKVRLIAGGLVWLLTQLAPTQQVYSPTQSNQSDVYQQLQQFK